MTHSTGSGQAHSTHSAGSGQAGSGQAQLRIVSSGATAEEIAAVTAVLQGALDQLADEASAADGPIVSAWQRSQRPLRQPMTPGPGQWRSFAG